MPRTGRGREAGPPGVAGPGRHAVERPLPADLGFQVHAYAGRAARNLETIVIGALQRYLARHRVVRSMA